jgi:exopolysaccharide biosynthesis polyprenyl glycosylphosphotransferase
MAAPDFVAPNFYTETIAPLAKERAASSKVFFKNALAVAEATADFLTCSTGLFVAYVLGGSVLFAPGTQHSLRESTAMGAAFGLIVIFLLNCDGSYSSGGGLLQIRETERDLRIPGQALFLLLVIGYLLGVGFSCGEFVVAIILVPTLLILEKQIFLLIARKLQRKLRNVERVVVLGGGDAGRNVVSALLHSPRLGFEPVAVIDDSPSLGRDCLLEMGYRGRRSIPIRPGPVTPALLKSLDCDLLLLASQNLSSGVRTDVSNAAMQIGLDVALLHGPGVSEQNWTELINVDGLSLTTVRERSISWFSTCSKRATDVVLSSILLVLLAPLLILIAILIPLDSPGPALFIQQRVGHNGKRFHMYKFRSMYADAPEYALSPTSSNDPRIARIGRLLRRMSLDELPQLINVFLGTMSLVGPRPEMPFIVAGYDARQRERLKVRPGITGLWQLSADRAFPIHQNIQYDLYYIRNQSFCMDAAILIHTLIFALCGGI